MFHFKRLNKILFYYTWLCTHDFFFCVGSP